MKENEVLNYKKLKQSLQTLRKELEQQQSLIQDIRYAQIYDKGRLTTLIKTVDTLQGKVDAIVTKVGA